MDQKKTIRPFSMKDKIGYTLGDLGCCFTEQYRAMYLSIFYTLILQVPWWTPARPPRAASSSRGSAPSPSPWQCCAYLALSM